MATTILKHNEMAVDTKAPHCRKCDRPMSISRVDTKVGETGIRSSMTYECIRCGATEVMTTRAG
jgi:ribosomal protein L40E